MTAAKKEKYVCSFCEGSAIEGILFPSDFSDRQECTDGKVFISKCDECDKYPSDTDAAEVVAKMFSWRLRRSMDKKDDISEEARRKAKNKSWFRPYFEVTIEEALATHQRAVPGTGNACGAANDCMLVKGHKGKHMMLYGNTRRVW